MSLLRPDVIKQHKPGQTNPLLSSPASFCMINFFGKEMATCWPALTRVDSFQACGGSLVSLVVTVARLLPTGRCWIGLGLNPSEVEFQWQYFISTVDCPSGLSEQTQATAR